MLHAYYRVPNVNKPKLRQIDGDYPNAVWAIAEFKQAVMAQLAQEREVFINPILIVAQGDKK